MPQRSDWAVPSHYGNQVPHLRLLNLQDWPATLAHSLLVPYQPDDGILPSQSPPRSVQNLSYYHQVVAQRLAIPLQIHCLAHLKPQRKRQVWDAQQVSGPRPRYRLPLLVVVERPSLTSLRRLNQDERNLLQKNLRRQVGQPLVLFNNILRHARQARRPPHHSSTPLLSPCLTRSLPRLPASSRNCCNFISCINHLQRLVSLGNRVRSAS